MKHDGSRDLIGAQQDADNTNNFQGRSSAFYGNRNALEKRILEEREQSDQVRNKVEETEEFLRLSKAAGERISPISRDEFEKRRMQERQTDARQNGSNSSTQMNATYKPHDQINFERNEAFAREQEKYQAAYEKRKEYEQRQSEANDKNDKSSSLSANPCYYSPTKDVSKNRKVSSTALSNASGTGANAHITIPSATINNALNNPSSQGQQQQI